MDESDYDDSFVLRSEKFKVKEKFKIFGFS